MFKRLCILFAGITGFSVANAAYTPVVVTGYTADVVCNGSGTALSSITADVDGAGYAFQASDFNPGTGTPTSYMPIGGLVSSNATAGMTYQLASYSANNSLRISATNGAGTLTFSMPAAAGEVWLVGTSGSGASVMSATVNFTDNTTQTFTGISNFSDWYGGTPFVKQGLGRTNTSASTIDNNPTDPRLYETKMVLSSLNAAKLIASITITKTNSGGVLNIMGVSILPSTICSGAPLAPVITSTAIGTVSCSNFSTTINATDPNQPVGGVLAGLSFQWQQATSLAGPWSSVTGGTGATTLSYTTPALNSNTYYRLVTTCTISGLSSVPSAVFLVPVGPQAAGAISGSPTFCPGATQVYTVPALPGATGYTWSLPVGWTTVGTTNTNTITTIAGSAGGVITVLVAQPCGVSSSTTATITAGTAPATPAAVIGNSVVCAGATQTYSVAPVTGATSYLWTLPSGWIGTSTTNTISVTPNATGGTLSVTAVNNCGSSAVLAFPISITTVAAVLGNITGNTPVCANSSQTYSLTAVQGVINYIWTLPTGWTGTSNTNTITVVPGNISGTISVTGQNGCSASAPKTLAVTAIPLVTPAVTIAPSSNNVCSGTTITLNASPLNGGAAPLYQWYQNNQPVNGNGASYTPLASINGDVFYAVLTSNAGCVTNTTATSNTVTFVILPKINVGININANTALPFCNGSSITFNSNVVNEGTSPFYDWRRNGLSTGINTPTYSTNTLQNGDKISCILTSNINCPVSPSVASDTIISVIANIVTPVAVITASPGLDYVPGQSITFTAQLQNTGTPSGNMAPAYQWKKNTINITGATGTTYTTSNLAPGDMISFDLTSIATCASPTKVTSNGLIINKSTGISGMSTGSIDMQLAPNPNNGHFMLSANLDASLINKVANVQVMNTLGQVIYSKETTPGAAKWTMDISLPDGLSNGLYMLRVSSGNKQSTARFEVNR